MARTKRVDRASPMAARARAVNNVALGGGATELTLSPAAPAESGARKGPRAPASAAPGSARGARQPLLSPARVAAASPMSPTQAVVAAVRGWQAAPPSGGQLIRPSLVRASFQRRLCGAWVSELMRAACCAQGSPRSDAPKKVAAPKVEHPCTTCGELMPSDGLERHPMLPVATCTRCVRYFLCDGQPDQWARYENGKEKYCSWCAHNDQCHEEGGGVIVECAREGCPKIFCKACIVRNFGDEHYQKAKADANWQCYGCEPGALRQLPSHEVVAGASSRAAAAPAKSASAGAGEVRSLLRLRFAQPNSRGSGAICGCRSART